MDIAVNNNNVMKVKLPNKIPPKIEFEAGIRRAPNRGFNLNRKETEIALRNALRC